MRRSNDRGDSRSGATDPKLSRRRLLVAGTTASALTAGCTDVIGLSSPSLPPCNGEQRDDPGTPRMGDENARLTVEVYEDLDCRHCAEFNQETAPAIKRDYVEPGDVRYVHRDFLVPVSEWSWKAANAARAVQQTAGDDAFFEFLDLAYANQGEYTESLLVSLGGDVGADEPVVERAIETRPYCEYLRSETESGSDRGVEGTPTVSVEGELLTGPSETELREAIDSRL